MTTTQLTPAQHAILAHAVEHPVEHLLACAAFDVVGEPVDFAFVGVDGLGKDGVLCRGELCACHLLLLLCWWMAM